MQRPISAAALLFALASAARADDVPTAPAAPAETGVAFEPGTPAFVDVLAKAKEQGKPAFIDFATDWCGWCKKLDKDVFSQAEAALAMKAFVNVHVDAEKGEGVELRKRYGVTGFPTLVVVDAAGEEIDRVVGYRPLPEFVKEMKRIAAGDGAIPAMRKAFAAAPDDVEAGMALGAKLAPSHADEASLLFADLEAKAKDKDHATQGRIRLEHAAALAGAGKKEAALAAAESLVKDFADSPSASEVLSRVGPGAVLAAESARALAFLDAATPVVKDTQGRVTLARLVLAIHQRDIAASFKRQAEAAGDDAQALNNLAWTCFEQKIAVKDALGWARTAVEKSERDPAIVDTLANLLWLTGKHDEALKLENEAAEKTADAKMKKEFVANVAKWTAELAAKKADGKNEDGEEDDEGDEDDE